MTPDSPDPQPESEPRDATPRLAWATPTPALIAVTGGGLVLAVAAILANEPASRLLVGLAALGLLALAGLGFRQRPRLAVVPGADPRMVVRTLLGADEYGREQIVRARVVDYRRLGRKMPMLEIDVDHDGTERLLIFGRWDLGTRPDDVYDILVRELRLSGETTR
ncbi:PH (Pleckstrin Homology) domain-containing protein [Nocardia tenerifensis]|uniref:PH (Pleckstrin Homology) domain-containing protein n=1 Tax=Nocardia tenerifensis TaxID=228006 RepID=A0A318K439_9NOCA|nr:PH domain-containing protein [Nocardia tenerifensis]PXX62963.1 PH (Pleckstrin Homology) domain-containing protein [Nocardia tenerifensis]